MGKSIIETNPALADMSVEEIQELLKEKQAAETAAKEKRKSEYVAAREELLNTLGIFAVSLRDQMIDLKYEAFSELLRFHGRMLEYGELRNGDKNKGNFELKNEFFKIKFSSQTTKKFDERATLAEEKLKQFLSSFVKKKERAAYDMIMGLLQRNEKTGEFDFDLINRLYSMENKFDNPLWKDALELFRESYSPYGSAQYIQFFTKNITNNSWEPVVLDFAKLKSFDRPKEEPINE